MEFFSKDWQHIGDKDSLERRLVEVTRIGKQALLGRALSTFSTQELLSWGEGRQTKHEEDKVYSLQGMFNVVLPMIYGEGYESAFRQLQDKIGQNTLYSGIGGFDARGKHDYICFMTCWTLIIYYRSPKVYPAKYRLGCGNSYCKKYQG